MGSAKIYRFCTPSLCVKVQIMYLIFAYEVQEMNEKKNKHKKRLDFQQKMIARYLEQIDVLKIENEKLEQKLKEKDEIINSVTPLRNELIENVNEVKKSRKEYHKLIQELKKMKSIIDIELYKGRWWLIKLLLK